jgi:hypothetical protein
VTDTVHCLYDCTAADLTCQLTYSWLLDGVCPERVTGCRLDHSALGDDGGHYCHQAQVSTCTSLLVPLMASALSVSLAAPCLTLLCGIAEACAECVCISAKLTPGALARLYYYRHPLGLLGTGGQFLLPLDAFTQRLLSQHQAIGCVGVFPGCVRTLLDTYFGYYFAVALLHLHAP